MTEARAKPEIDVRYCSTLAEYEECVRIEHLVWGEEISVPSGLFVVAHHTGGQTLGAFDPAATATAGAGGGRARMVGFTLALAAHRAGKPFLHSHLTGVLPEARDRGVGRRLKLFQREDALKRGMDLVEWTFDPLNLKNAHFNIMRLGAVVRRFIPNCYGITESPLHGGIPTDRLVAEWWLTSERVKSILAGRIPAMSASVERISLPANLAEIQAKDREAAIRIQADAREKFERWLAKGYAVTRFETRDAEASYFLEPAKSVAGLTFHDSAED